MITDSADIKFQCVECGQHLLVERSAAGLAAICPQCDTRLTVPHPGQSEYRPFAETAPPRGSEALRHREPPAGSREPAAQREAASRFSEHGRALPGTEGSRSSSPEPGRNYEEELRQAVEECARQTASNTQTLAELKSYQTERMQLRAELAQTRQRAHAWETKAAEAREKSASEMRAQASQLQILARELAEERARVRESEKLRARTAQTPPPTISLPAADSENAGRMAELQARLEKAQSEAEQAQARAKTLEAAREEAQKNFQRLELEQEKLQSAHGTLQRDLADALARGIATAEECERARLDLENHREHAAEDAERDQNQLAELREKLSEKQASATEIETMKAQWTARLNRLEQDLALAVSDAQTTEIGRDMLALRERARRLEAKAREFKGALEEERRRAEKLIEGEKNVRIELAEARHRLHAAEVRAEATSDERLRVENEALRGIIARQNAALGTSRAEPQFAPARAAENPHVARRNSLHAVLAYALLGALIVGSVIAWPYLRSGGNPESAREEVGLPIASKGSMKEPIKKHNSVLPKEELAARTSTLAGTGAERQTAPTGAPKTGHP